LWLPEIYRASLERGVDATLTIVGDGPDSERLHQRLSDYGLHERTRFFRGLTPERVYRLLMDAHLLLMPSQYEGLPIALLESQACGCVPIVSRLPGITDVAVSPGETGVLVDVGDVSGFADAVATLSRDPARWSRMSSAGHELVSHRFSTRTMGQSYLRLIGDAMNGRYPLPRSRREQRALDLGVFSWRDFLPNPVRQWGREGRVWLKRFSRAGPVTARRHRGAEESWDSTFKP
jgi:glycosyltransferase involved in cell wall biosynthesis